MFKFFMVREVVKPYRVFLIKALDIAEARRVAPAGTGVVKAVAIPSRDFLDFVAGIRRILEIV